MSDARSLLVAAGMSETEAQRKQLLFERAVAVLSGFSDVDDRVVFRWWVPGRIEFLGKHTDYAGGRSLLCAAERGICLAAALRRDDRVRVHDAISGDTLEFRMSESATDDSAPQSGRWSVYVHAVASRIVRNFPTALIGADIVIASDLPQAAGMSSSSALVVAIFLALARVNDIESRPEYRRAIRTNEQLAEYLGTIENGQSFGELVGERGVGTFGGSEDHTAMLCARAGVLIQYAFCPVRLERTVPLPADHVLVVATSGVAAEKTGAVRERYNSLSRAAAEILERWESVTGERYPTLAAAVNGSPDAISRVSERLGADRLARLEHFLLESENFIPRAADALADGDLEMLGTLVDQSQHGAEQLLGNQIPETIFLARRARELGAIAASAFGAGFGGSVWALVRETGVAEFRAKWEEAYAARFPAAAARSEIFVSRAGPGVVELSPTENFTDRR
ncbi:MAG TPA: galactokinase family protein [Gemmatimonadaceae bacterium]|nr:galactokinase family protein [Gemmatimonadaceae bacterium]